jgi:hypothetical protein
MYNIHYVYMCVCVGGWMGVCKARAILRGEFMASLILSKTREGKNSKIVHTIYQERIRLSGRAFWRTLH